MSTSLGEEQQYCNKRALQISSKASLISERAIKHWQVHHTVLKIQSLSHSSFLQLEDDCSIDTSSQVHVPQGNRLWCNTSNTGDKFNSDVNKIRALLSYDFTLVVHFCSIGALGLLPSPILRGPVSSLLVLRLSAILCIDTKSNLYFKLAIKMWM